MYVGDKFKVIDNACTTANVGDIVTLVEDDGTDCPWFSGSTEEFFVTLGVERVSIYLSHLEEV